MPDLYRFRELAVAFAGKLGVNGFAVDGHIAAHFVVIALSGLDCGVEVSRFFGRENRFLAEAAAFLRGSVDLHTVRYDLAATCPRHADCLLAGLRLDDLCANFHRHFATCRLLLGNDCIRSGLTHH